MASRELRSSFQNLSDQSIKTSRLLDDTYYSLLERVAQCRQTIGSLQELANLTQELHHTFESDTKELVEDVQGQFESFGGFKAQQEHVAALEERIIAGKDKADALNARLEEARRRIDARTELEAKLGARNTRMTPPRLDNLDALANMMCRSYANCAKCRWRLSMHCLPNDAVPATPASRRESPRAQADYRRPFASRNHERADS